MRTLVPWRRHGLANAAVRDPFTAMQNDLQRTFEGLLDHDFFGLPSTAAGLNPRLDVSETEQEIHVTAELPGMTETDVDVELLEDAVKIRGEKKDERETKNHSFHRTERSFGMFERIVALPKPIQRDAVTATFKNGVLNIVLPKQTPVVNHQKIQVQAG